MSEVSRHDLLKRCGHLCLWLNVLLMGVKLSVGYFYASRALFADGIHSLLDVTADMFVLYAVSMSAKPKDVQHPYGYSRYETLANIVIAVMLIMAVYAIIYDAVQGFYQPSLVMDFRVGIVAGISIVLNEASYRYVSYYAKLLRSDLLMSTAVHQRADAGTSVIVLLATAASFADLTGADLFGAIGIALMILYYALPSLIKSIKELLDQGLDTARLAEIETIINGVPGVVDHHFLRSRFMAEKGYVDVHVVVSPRISVSEGHYIGDVVKETLLKCHDIGDITVHIDAEDDQHYGAKLPDRLTIQEWVDRCEHIDSFQIHYLNGTVELDLVTTQERVVVAEKPLWLSVYRLNKVIKC
ncbi:cation diffusion facilitator family transporter [Candidatus Synchoanobacter obligatus]|uniref:Cation diffusion facilitator family transporter n=1 Tax=Candidatus Synchoanobacter obligatus TaxID=2919597 RepID=A0ABT1L631_9GAMM|nr:cation diffusion facilitator family transporter [Candidatus Synchoanobacter obligatus]MCP8352629.1 cation diffusion facilitator family transporter [Candidatus Synchoanobacter obligatus]